MLHQKIKRLKLFIKMFYSFNYIVSRYFYLTLYKCACWSLNDPFFQLSLAFTIPSSKKYFLKEQIIKCNSNQFMILFRSCICLIISQKKLKHCYLMKKKFKIFSYSKIPPLNSRPREFFQDIVIFMATRRVFWQTWRGNAYVRKIVIPRFFEDSLILLFKEIQQIPLKYL